MRSLFNASFKTNPFLERAVMTGITRVSRESIFSDLNNLKIVTTTSEEYADSFGFTQEETRGALMNMDSGKRPMKSENGMTALPSVQNPILQSLVRYQLSRYRKNSSLLGKHQLNSLVGKLIREGSRKIKTAFEDLLQAGV